MKNKICNISLFSAILAGVAALPSTVNANARGRQSYAGAYNQVAIMQEQLAYAEATNAPEVQTASAVEDLPVEVEDKELAEKILNHDPDAPTIEELERCAMTHIRGVFKWGIPKSGMRKNSKPQCIAVVDLIDENQQVLATTTVATGDAITCNIDEFPEDGYETALSTVELPADAAPTMKDVEKVLNKEQKQNAGFKIAAAALIGGLAGNMLGPKQNGDEKLLGTGKKQLGTTALGAAAAAGIMAASSYSGKVAGDTIKSTAVSAAAGMMAGNMAAGLMGSNSVMATTTCSVQEEGKKNTVEKDCVIGRYYVKSGTLANYGNSVFYSDKDGGNVQQCNAEGTICSSFSAAQLINIRFVGIENGNVAGSLTEAEKGTLNEKKACLKNGSINVNNCENYSDEKHYFQISTADLAQESKPGYAVFNKIPHKVFGYKISDWSSLSKQPHDFYRRDTTTNIATNKEADATRIEFVPSARSAQDGSVIDLTNEARAKATMIGAAAGGALGGFTGYQNAQNEMTERWLAAMADYDASLSSFACVSGGYFLYYYNGYAAIPAMPASTEISSETQE